MQFLHDVLLALLTGYVEPLVELLGITKDFGKEEVEEGPQLVEVVLEGSTGDEDAMLRLHGTNDLAEGRILVLDAMGFIDDEVLPIDLPQWTLLLQNGLVGGNEHIELVLAGIGILGQLVLDDISALLLGTAHLDGTDAGAPLANLTDPIAKNGLGNHNNVRPAHATALAKVRQKRNGLQCLAQT